MTAPHVILDAVDTYGFALPAPLARRFEKLVDRIKDEAAMLPNACPAVRPGVGDMRAALAMLSLLVARAQVELEEIGG